ncbi:MAG: o-succinylbenzoate synthase [Odoribacter sp.]
MLCADYMPYLLHFKQPSGTSRGILTDKQTFFIRIWEEHHPNVWGIGECALFRGLSSDDLPGYEQELQYVCRHIDVISLKQLQAWSSIRFGVETALADLRHGGRHICFPSPFTQGEQSIEINGLIWMGDRDTMQQRIREKIDAGFHCLKLKIGAIDFESELNLLKSIRQQFSFHDLQLRVDANGAFTSENALSRIEALAHYHLHSIEQPIRQGQPLQMSRLSAVSPIPIALDEELIGINDAEQKQELLATIRPAYIVLKPALCGGFHGALEWIQLAEKTHIGWWITSALESNIGLNAIAQWTATLNNLLPQGLGTGQLYTNNIPSPLRCYGEKLQFDTAADWDFKPLNLPKQTL